MLRNVGLRKSVEQPVLDLNFAASQIGSNAAPDSRIDFSRGSNAWFVDSDGLLKKSPHNLQVNSEDFSEAGWSKTNSTVEANSIVAPDGTLTADKIVGNSTNNYHNVTDTIAVTSGTQYWISIYIKVGSAGTEFAFIETLADGGLSKTVFQFETETFLVTDSSHNHVSATDVGNGWYRFVCSVTPNANRTGNVYFGISDGTDAIYDATGEFIYFWGAQISQHTTLPVGNPYIRVESNSTPVYAARLDHDPSWFMSAAQEQNLEANSEDLDEARDFIVRVTVTDNDTTAPDGTTTADKMVVDGTANSTHYLRFEYETQPDIATTFSLHAKADELSQFRIRTYGSLGFENSAASTFDLSAETASKAANHTTATIEALDDGWFRVSVTENTNSDDETRLIQVELMSGGTDIFDGDSTSGMHFWGLQFEVGSTASTYHRTTGAPYYGPGATPKGLLIEEARTNLLQQSETFDTTWTDTGCSITADAVLAPSGAVTGDKLIKDAAFGFASLSQNVTLSSAGGTAIMTLYAKAGERDKIALREGAVTGGYAAFDLTNGTVLDENNINDSSITPAGNGWFRILIDVTLSSGTNYGGRIVPLPDSYTSGSVTASFSDDGTSGVYIWGSQIEEGSFATSYIETIASTATRNADVAVMGPTTGGTELVTNGTFDTATDWNLPSGGEVTIAGGVLDYSSAPQYKSTRQQLESRLVIGRRYRASIDIVSITSGAIDLRYFEDGVQIANTGNQTTAGTYSIDFTCSDLTSCVFNIQSRTTGLTTAQIDNASLRELYPFEQYNPSEGTVVCSNNHDQDGAARVWMFNQDNSSSPRIDLSVNSSQIINPVVANSGGTAESSLNLGSYTLGSDLTTAVAFKEDNYAASDNGDAVSTDTSGAMQAVDELTFGSFRGISSFICGHISRFSYYPRRLPDETLESLSND